MINYDTKRLIIRELTMHDTVTIYNFSQEETLAQWIPNQVYDDLDEATEVLTFLINSYSNMELPLVMAIELKSTHEMIGHVGLSTVNDVIEIGYAIGTDHQGNGYAKEPVISYVTWGKENLKIHQIYGLVTVVNLASTKVLEFNLTHPKYFLYEKSTSNRLDNFND